MLSKDILGIIVVNLSFKDVLNLRLTCKKYNEYITGYNKYWFVKVLPYMQLKSRHVKPFVNMKNKQGENIKISLFWLECVTPEKTKTITEIDLEVVSHVDYKKWQEKLRKKLHFTAEEMEKSLNTYSYKRFAKGYYRGKYLKQKYPNHICPDFSHWGSTPKDKWLQQESVNLIHPEVTEYYQPDVNYFSIYVDLRNIKRNDTEYKNKI
tara:strand:- start:122 stop:745 length:624 start_codon:yes stop_codon:yes gene_type:complete